MRPPPKARRGRFLHRGLVLAALATSAALGAPAACGSNQIEDWVCNNPATGKADVNVADPTHYTNGVFDPCFCYGVCGPAPECPILVDAGTPPPDAMCDAGADGP